MPRWLILSGFFVAFAGLGGCRPKVGQEPPPQSAGHVPTESDAGLPAVPLSRRSVVVPSDVKLQPGPAEAKAPAAPPTGASFSPPGN
jgi:hypothetical protein